MKCAFRNNAFRISLYKIFSILKNYSKHYLLFFYYYSINSSQVQRPFGFLFVIFFSVRATTLNFLEFYFYALRRFLADFQAYIASSGQKLFQTA